MISCNVFSRRSILFKICVLTKAYSYIKEGYHLSNTYSKRNRFGIKLFVLCVTQSGIVQDFILYNGSLTILNYVNEFIRKTGNIVMELLKP